MDAMAGNAFYQFTVQSLVTEIKQRRMGVKDT